MAGSRHVVLMGMMGAGKSTVGTALATRLGVSYTDNDVELAARAGHDAAWIARERGAAALHLLEIEILTAAVARDDRSVVGAPGSVALFGSAASLLAGQFVVWLRARPETLAARVRRGPTRPYLEEDVTASLRVLAAEREPGFARLAGLTIDVDAMSVDAIVDRVIKGIGTG